MLTSTSLFLSLLAGKDEIAALANEYQSSGPISLAKWLQNKFNVPISSHRAYFRSKLHPRAVESYQYSILGPRPCEAGARFRRFAFTYMDCELSRGYSDPADNTGQPYTQMKIETIDINGNTHYAVKFGDDVRTIIDSPLQYYEGDTLTDLGVGSYTICNIEEVMVSKISGFVLMHPLSCLTFNPYHLISGKGNQIGDTSFDQIGNYAFQILVGDSCTSSYTVSSLSRGV